MKHRGPPIFVLALLLAACAPSASPSPTQSPTESANGALVVTLTAGPVCPVEQIPPDPNCAPRPVAGEVVSVALPDGQVVDSQRTDAQGRANFSLRPGAYVVTAPEVPGYMGRPEPTSFDLAALEFLELDLEYDTGIR